MFCNQCGNEVTPHQQYCNRCGKRLLYVTEKKKTKNNTVLPITIVAITIGFIAVLLFYSIFLNHKNDYYFSSEETLVEQTTQTVANTNTSKKGKYKTAIITDNVYSGVSIKNVADANELIREDSIKQKQTDYPKEIIQIENSIIQKYSITAVNLKEMEVGFAKELEKVIQNIYENYSSARGYLTNLTLTNLSMAEADVIALFRPIFLFAKSGTASTRPWVIKTQVELNAKYFLNPERLESAVKMSSNSGHFPQNATKYSPIAHEFGHYLSFIALLNQYATNSMVVVGDKQMQDYYAIVKDFGYGDFSKKMLEEAYQNYTSDNGSMAFDEWRGQISGYALAKDETGDFIYDETIAEAFHDVYLNHEKASEPSKYIVEVLKKYLER